MIVPRFRYERLTSRQSAAIRGARAAGVSAADLAREYGVASPEQREREHRQAGETRRRNRQQASVPETTG